MKISEIFESIMFGMNYLFLLILLFGACTTENSRKFNCISINFWYGDQQSFGTPGLAQQWINILGNVRTDHGIQSLYYQLNDSDTLSLSWGIGNHRLANPGDFNIEIHNQQVMEGTNRVLVSALDSAGHRFSKQMEFNFNSGKYWPLPYTIEWKKVNNIQEVAQIVDGHWQLTPDGVRTLDPWYDRIIAVGDNTWKNYEITTTVIFFNFTPPVPGPPNYGVSHAALAMRWPGHDVDDHQPHIKWYPLGATCEFQLKNNLDSCRWRILGNNQLRTEDTYQHFSIHLGEKYYLKSRVENIERRLTRYRVKIWSAESPEPESWQLTAVEGSFDMPSGSALLIAHNTDVLFGNVNIKAVE